MIRSSCFGWRACAHVRETEFPQKLSDKALVIVDVEAQRNHALQVDASAAHHPVGHFWASFNDRGQFRQLIRRQPRLRLACPIVRKTVRAALVEPVHPVAQGLAIHAADPGRLAAIHAVANRRQRQKTATLVPANPDQRTALLIAA
jgi:hypothetical protein